MKTVGIIGGGQLGRMLTEAAIPLGFDVIVLDPTKNCPASLVGAKQIVGSLTDKLKIKDLAEKSDYLTWEIEHISTDILGELLIQGIKINPSPKTLNIIKDKLSQKEFLNSLNIAVAPFMQINNKEDLSIAGDKFGYPLVLKNRYGGYDGRGNFVIRSKKDIDRALEVLGSDNLYVEQSINFEKELAVMAARDISGNVVTYPVVETVHINNILNYVLAPAPVTDEIINKAKTFAIEVLNHLDGAGVFGVELFLSKNGEVLVNEIAPRVHNSGHYTIEACTTSQFENHIRAITGMKLGKTDMKVKAAVMINILGKKDGNANLQGLEKAQQLGEIYLHIYGKLKTKPQRKMGHITVLDTSLENALNVAKKARSLIKI